MSESTDPGLAESRKYLVIGLGNPGRNHRNNRHNLGFMVVDRFAARRGIALSRVESKAIVGSELINDCSITLAKPMTYMNQSGRSVGALSRYYKIETDRLLVIYDEIDLPFGAIRLREGGGSGGHNGMRSIIEQIGSEFPRIRIGVGRPTGRMDAASYVLQNFSKEESEQLDGVIDLAVDALELFLFEGIDTAMNRYNRMPETE